MVKGMHSVLFIICITIKPESSLLLQVAVSKKSLCMLCKALNSGCIWEVHTNVTFEASGQFRKMHNFVNVRAIGMQQHSFQTTDFDVRKEVEEEKSFM